MPEIRMPDLSTDSLTSQMRASAESAVTMADGVEEADGAVRPPDWALTSTKPDYKPVSVGKAKDALKNAEQKSRRYGKWPRSWFRNQGRIDEILFGAVRHLIRLAVKFDAGLRKHERTLRKLLPKVGVLHLSAQDLQAEYLRLSSRVDQLESQARQQRMQIQHQSKLIATLTEEAARVGGSASGLNERVEDLTGEVERFRRRLWSLPAGDEFSMGSQPRAAGEVSPAPHLSNTSFDSLYLKFENQFRGAEEMILRRLRVYLPLLEKACPGSRPLVALDIGCGRGEWLQLLKEQGVVARGVDASSDMVALATKRGVEAVLGDGLEYLRRQPARSLGLVTAFHVVEHLSTADLLALLEETARVLVPGGMAIFETPNAANVTVSAFSFHLDPTHRHPLPAPLLAFLCQSTGLTRTEVLELHPHPSEAQVPEEGSPELARRFNQLFYGPQDYAVIAWTPA